MATSPHISISAETLFYIGHLAFTNSMLTSLVISLFIIGFALLVRLKLKHTPKPQGLQNFAEWLVEVLYNFTQTITGNNKKTRSFLAFFATFFIFILLNNWSGLLPGVGTLTITAHSPQSLKAVKLPSTQVRLPSAQIQKNTENTDGGETNLQKNAEDSLVEKQEETSKLKTHHETIPIFRSGSADLNTTLALAIISVITTQIFGLITLKFSYLKKFFNFSDPISFFVGFLEIVSEMAKIISFAFRLFGNIFAGEVLLVVLTFLVPIILPMPFYGLELFVGFIQAFVFAMLSLVFFNMATQGHEH